MIHLQSDLLPGETLSEWRRRVHGTHRRRWTRLRRLWRRVWGTA
jgi:hypothetical protein